MDKNTVLCNGGLSLDEVLMYGALSANIVSEEPIDVVMHEAYPGNQELWNHWKLSKFTPFNPVDKYTIAAVTETKTGQAIRIMKGAPQVHIPATMYRAMC